MANKRRKVKEIGIREGLGTVVLLACLASAAAAAPFEYAQGKQVAIRSGPFDYAQGKESAAKGAEYVVEYYYKARWGHADEWLALFRKNHLPVLKALQEQGRIVRIEMERPRYHATEDGRWDYRVTITWKNAAASMDSGDEQALARRLFPDQETFKREEQRRFEILLAHWDVPILRVEGER